jgi:hypothetical protein
MGPESFPVHRGSEVDDLSSFPNRFPESYAHSAETRLTVPNRQSLRGFDQKLSISFVALLPTYSIREESSVRNIIDGARCDVLGSMERFRDCDSF